LCASVVWSTSTIANFELGKLCAAVSIASASVKPTPIVRLYLCRAKVERFGTYCWVEFAW
jgi:hypothetical protein